MGAEQRSSIDVVAAAMEKSIRAGEEASANGGGGGVVVPARVPSSSLAIDISLPLREMKPRIM